MILATKAAMIEFYVDVYERPSDEFEVLMATLNALSWVDSK